jgi:hypothetical protein
LIERQRAVDHKTNLEIRQILLLNDLFSHVAFCRFKSRAMQERATQLNAAPLTKLPEAPAFSGLDGAEVASITSRRRNGQHLD